MASIREIALRIGVDLTSKVRRDAVKTEQVHKILHSLAEDFSEKLGLADLAMIVGSNPELLGRKIAFNEADEPISVALRNSLKWAVIEECAGYRDDNEAYTVAGTVLDSLRQFADRLRSGAERGALNSLTVSDAIDWIDRLHADASLEGAEYGLAAKILSDRVSELGMVSSRLRGRMAAAADIPKERLHDVLLDRIDSLGFLAARRPNVLLREVMAEVPGLTPAKRPVR
jgi:hypothetical protein